MSSGTLPFPDRPVTFADDAAATRLGAHTWRTIMELYTGSPCCQPVDMELHEPPRGQLCGTRKCTYCRLLKDDAAWNPMGNVLNQKDQDNRGLGVRDNVQRLFGDEHRPDKWVGDNWEQTWASTTNMLSTMMWTENSRVARKSISNFGQAHVPQETWQQWSAEKNKWWLLTVRVLVAGKQEIRVLVLHDIGNRNYMDFCREMNWRCEWYPCNTEDLSGDIVEVCLGVMLCLYMHADLFLDSVREPLLEQHMAMSRALLPVWEASLHWSLSQADLEANRNKALDDEETMERRALMQAVREAALAAHEGRQWSPTSETLNAIQSFRCKLTLRLLQRAMENA